MNTTSPPWSGIAIARAVDLLHHSAAARPKDGIDADDAAALLSPFYEPAEAVDFLWMAEDRGLLLRVSRLTIDAEGEMTQEDRYFARGGSR